MLVARIGVLAGAIAVVIADHGWLGRVCGAERTGCSERVTAIVGRARMFYLSAAAGEAGMKRAERFL